MISRFVSSAISLLVLTAVVPAAAQHVDPRTCAHGTLECNQARSAKAEGDAAYAEETREWQALRGTLLKSPPLPAERNALLGNWRLGDDQRSSIGELGRENDSEGLGGILTMLSSMRLEKIGCEAGFSSGMTFTASTYSGGGVTGVVKGAPIAYRSARSGAKSAIAAIPGDGGMMIFEVANPNQIVSNDGCVLVRNGSPAAGSATPMAAVAPTFEIQYEYQYKCGNERVEVFSCRNDEGQQWAEIDNFCQVQYPDRPRRMEAYPISGSVRKSDLVKQLANCTGPAASTP